MIFCIPCLVLLVYFGVLGIFSPKYRIYIKEGWKCFIDKLRGRICSMSFDNKMRIALSMWLAEKGFVRAAKFFHNERNFKIVLTTIGIVFTVISIYLFWLLLNFLFVKSPCVAGICAI